VLPLLPNDVVYVVAGEGPEREAIEAAARRASADERVVLTGRVSEEEVRGLYRRADVFVMPNVPVAGDVEGFGLVALEAAVEGLPVVASRLEGIPDAVRDGLNGTLVEPLDPRAFAERLTTLLAMAPAERGELGERCKRFTLENYSWERMATEYGRALDADSGARQSAVEAEAA
jgi:phosphatidylinositol alpha-1,6-mannosyltransferase